MQEIEFLQAEGLSDLNLFPEREVIYKLYEKVPSDPRFHSVGLYGNPNEVLNGEINEHMSADDLARWIEADPQFKNRAIVKLDSCNTANAGSDGISFAQKLANRLNVPIMAPTTEVQPRNGKVSLNKLKPGRWVLFKPKK